jgi:catechol 2,3-dioxygenase-like lactoylglutathione lyase family enzyme
MALEVIGIDHIYITASDFARSELFYDRVMEYLGFRKGTDPVGGQPHAHYFNRAVQYTVRPAKPDALPHDPLVPGLHHLCFQVENRYVVDEAVQGLRELGIRVSEPRIYPDYGPDYYAIYFKDPDGIELEIVNRTRLRDLIQEHWGKLESFENPLSKAGII